MRNHILPAVLAGLSIAGVASVAPAATVSFNIAVNTTTSTYVVTASDSANDNFGIASYGFTLSNFTTLTNVSPLARFNDAGANQIGEAGFSEINTGNNINPSGGGQAIANANGDAIYIFNIGQSGGDLRNVQPANSTLVTPVARAVYAAPVVLAMGGYTGTAPTITASQALVFTSKPTVNTSTPTTGDATTNNGRTFVPEPATLGLLALAGLGLGRRRRYA